MSVRAGVVVSNAIPSFYPFCLRGRSLSPSKRTPRIMNLLTRTNYQKHIAIHFNGANTDSVHSCPYFPKTCSYQKNITPTELTSHLSYIYNIQKAKISQQDRHRNIKVLSKISVNIQTGAGEEKPSKRARK